MKRTGKILSLVLSLVLVVCALVAVFAFNASAAETTYVRSGADTGYDYVHKDNAGKTGTIQMVNTADLQEAFANALQNTTIYMNSNMTFEFTSTSDYLQVGHRLKPEAGQQTGAENINNWGGPFTFDMGGNTLTFVQKGPWNTINFASAKKFTFKNGTINVGMAGADGTGGSAYPLIRHSWGNSSVAFENVNTRSAGLVLVSNERGNENNTLSIKGGTHYVIASGGPNVSAIDNMSVGMGAFIDARANLTATIEGATFYIEEGNYLINMASYARHDITGAKSMFVFDGCTVLGENATTSLIKNLNSVGTVSFSESCVYGSIDPSVMDLDVAEGYTAATDKNVIFGHNVKYSSEATLNVSYEKGAEQQDKTNTVTTPILPETFNGIGQVDTQGLNGVYTFTESTKDITFDKLNYVNNIFEILGTDGVSRAILPYGTKIGDAIAQLNQGETLKLLGDVHSVGEEDANGNGKTYIAKITKSITIDLNGFMWTIEQVPGSNGSVEQRVGVQTTQPVTIKNGTLGARVSNSTNTAYTFFQSEGYKIDMTFENVNTYVATLVFVWRGCDSKITLNGGVHQSVFASTGGPAGYIATNDNAHVVANNATFYISNEYNYSPRLFSASHSSADLNVTKNKNITFTYNNCDIISTSISGVDYNYTMGELTVDSMIGHASADTTVSFNGCRIFGLMTGDTLYNSSRDTKLDAGSIKFGHGTKFVNTQLRTDGVVVSARLTANEAFKAMDAETVTYTFDKLYSSDVFGNDWAMQEVSFELVYDMYVEADEAFEVLNADGTHKEYLKDTFTNGVVTDKYTFYEVIDHINGLGSGYTVKFLYDYVTDVKNEEEGVFTDSNSSYYAVFKKGVTVDLNGFELRLIKGTDFVTWANAGQEKFSIQTSELITFKNGTIKAVDQIKTDRVFPIFSGDASVSNLLIENVDTHCGGLFYSYNSKANITVNGGYHQSYVLLQGVNGTGWVTCRNTLNLTINDAVYTANSGVAIVDVNSASAAIATNENTSYVLKFNNTNIIMSSVSHQIISRMNAKTTVYFNGCSLFGSLNPSLTTITAHDSTASDGKFRNRSIIMGVDENRVGATGKATVWTTAGTVNSSLIFGQAGYGIINEESSNSITFPAYTNKYTPHTLGWHTTDTTYNATFNKSIATGYEVNFYLYNSTTPIDTIWVAPGYEAFLPEIELTDVNNGWYKLTYTPGKWSTTPISSAALAEGGNKFQNTEASLVINEATSFYPVCQFKPYLTAASYNLTLMSHFAVKFYVPTSTPTGITVNSIGGTAAAKMSKANLMGVQYYVQSLGNPDATAIYTRTFTSSVVFTVSDVLDTNGEAIQLTQNVGGMSVYNYAKRVLEAKNVGLTGEELAEAQQVMADMLRYSYAVHTYRGTTTIPDAEQTYALLTAHMDKCSNIDYEKFDSILSSTTADFSTLGGEEGPISAFTFDVSQDKPRLMIYFKEGAVNKADASKVKFTIEEGWLYNTSYNNNIGGKNWGSTPYIPNTNWDMYYYTSVEGIIVRGSGSTASGYTVVYDFNTYTAEQIKNGDKSKVGKKLDAVDANATVTSLYSLRADNMPIYNIDKVLTITVPAANGTTYTGTYDIDSYYIAQKAALAEGKISQETFNKVQDLLFIIKAYSYSAAGYRFGPAHNGEDYVFFQ